ncbi:IclR family transcriptional regulator [Sphingobium sp. EP60837]|uniref:IclR family transcriptional regulator n=1 Tax=Sphingobium sp. EP60837 TaxID=1855519 RepID=UPI0007DD1CFD|nr:IclR family transcriptional regulator [Sphingobium sp. EP60837]ANI80165.1 HTH-type transcriptional regulator KipR [Sphingobium sp. EP60837]
MANKVGKLSKSGHIEAEPAVEIDRDASSSLAKALSILDLFSENKPIWTTNEILDALGATRSTGYRYIRALTSAGLLGAVGNGYYVLGSRIIELDLLIRNTDPLLKASEGILGELVKATTHSALLCMLFQNSLVCIADCQTQFSPKTIFARGQRRPLFKGAVSRVVLANLPNHRLRSIFARRQDAILEARLGDSWEEFNEAMSKIRSEGFVKSIGEFNPGIVGIAAPVFNGEDAIIGSVGVSWEEEEIEDIDINRTVLLVKRAAREISQRMAKSDSELILPPRAVG